MELNKEVKCDKCESTYIIAYVTEKNTPLCPECFYKFRLENEKNVNVE